MPKYTLTGEEGPPHHKSFTVTLELGPGEKFEGTGTSIKKAQHAAAKKAIDGCQTLERPKYKPKRPKQINYGKNINVDFIFSYLNINLNLKIY